MPNPRPSLPPNPPPPAPSLLPDVTTHISTIKSNLRAHSRYIRDTLQPHLSTPGATLTPTELSTLKSIFASVSAIPITLELLQYSRIEKAVAVVASGGGAWPADASLMAETLLNRWEEKVGPMKNVKADLWGQGGRLEGCRKVDVGWEAEGMGLGQERRGSAWEVEFPGAAGKAYAYGDLGFEIGSWWLKPAAAFRDGIIDSRHYSITADEFGAYAILLEGDSERPGVTEAMVKEPSDSTEFAALKTSGVNKWRHKNYDVERPSIRFLPTPGDPGIHKLTREISRRNGIRVMRMAKLKSPLAPRVGVRYDGLYRVIAYSVGLSTIDGKDRWIYTFQLARQIDPPQEGIEVALAHPTADELDDWKDYRREKAREKRANLLSLRWGESHHEKKKGNDSGYFSLTSEWGKNLLRGELE